MAVFATRIIKEAEFQGAMRRFGNTYHYNAPLSAPFNDQEIGEGLADLEGTITSSSVRFVGWQTWGPTDGDAVDNVMREDGELDFTGDGMAQTDVFREVCMLLVWPLPRSEVRNRKRWLRKFIRMAAPSDNDLSAGVYAGVDPIDSNAVSSVEASYLEPVRSTFFADLELSTDDGTETTGPGVVRPYMITRQIGK